MFRNSTRKNEHVWDFSRNAPERMKRQVFDILHYELENSTSPEGRRVHLLGLRTCMTFVRSSGSRISKPWNCRRYRRSVKSPATGSRKASALNHQLLPKSAVPASGGNQLERPCMVYGAVPHTARADGSRKPCVKHLLCRSNAPPEPGTSQRYIRYGLGITNLSVGVIRGELIYLRSFLNDIQQPEDTDICSVTPAQMEAYFRVQRQRGVQAKPTIRSS